MVFQDRKDAGLQLVSKLQSYKNRKDVVVLGLARGGVVVAHAVAKALNLPLDVIVVRKVGAPFNEELAIGAIAQTGQGIFNERLIASLGVSRDYIEKEVARQKKIAENRLASYRSSSKAVDIKGKTVILVDDGIATGASMRVAIKSVKGQGAKKIVLAIPVAAQDALQQMKKEVDEIFCLDSPDDFEAVGQFYKRFDQTEDDEIITLLSSDGNL